MYTAQSKEALVKTTAAEINLEKYIVNASKKEKKENWLKEWRKKHYMDNLWGKQNATMKVKSGMVEERRAERGDQKSPFRCTRRSY